jgi:tellurite resistance protein TerC
MLFPFAEYWTFYAGFLALVLGLLALDLGVFHKDSHEVSFKEASIWTTIWISLAMVFNGVLYLYASNKFGEEIGKQVGLEFLTGFVVEKTLAVDNIFIFVLVFTYFKVPKHLQHKVLFYGILGALFFRALFIALGSVLMQYEWIVLIFGLFLIFTGAKMLKTSDDEKDLEDDPILKMMKKIIPLTNKYHGDKFFIVENGKKLATPLFMALLFLEASDIIFAIDSVPAIFALTKEPFIVFTSNIFAILGLRSLYFMLGGVMDKFIYLKQGLALVLIFVGLKMSYLNNAFGGKFPISWSLGIIALLIGGSIILSLLKKKD